MGNETSSEKIAKKIKRSKQKQCIAKNQPEEKAWDSVFYGTVNTWLQEADNYGLSNHQTDCFTSHMCDRDHVCYCYLSVIHRRLKRELEVIRFNEPLLKVPLEMQSPISRLLSSYFNKNLMVVAVSSHIAVLEITVGERRHAFPILNTKERTINVVYEPEFELTLMEGKISPDLSKTGLLLHSANEDWNGMFTYDLFLISNTTGELLSRTCLGTNDVQPHFAFHPSYPWSHILVTGYGQQNKRYAFLNLMDKSCVFTSSPDSANILGYQQLHPTFSPDGRFLFIQRLSDDQFGLYSVCHTYVFNVRENGILFIKYIKSKIPGIFHSCRVWYKPVISSCGQYLRIMNKSKNVMNVAVYRLPNVLQLRSRCRQVIVSFLSSKDLVDVLPIPNKLKQFLLFCPNFNDYTFQ